ncbi:MAG TPA: hypothetical protein ENK01_03795 [Hellea balneolensis]|uniref:Apea-like HEPN domain-containing protein n=1 Tax=Hellea balneolensis TaxID=287478 RepID=A0A7V5U1K0_9PROT|nr:hypothetical protein [Hellea balneolensis]
MSLRVHRALSWIKAAEQAGSEDARFLFYWIAFNAAYAKPITKHESEGESESFRSFFKTMLNVDRDGRIYETLWQSYPGPIRILLENKFVYGPFWRYHAGLGERDWEVKFATSRKLAGRALESKDSLSLLTNLFSRIYVLRNQIVHGGATWGSKVNRDQIRDCTNLLRALVPCFVSLMMDSPNRSWDAPSYPVVDG